MVIIIIGNSIVHHRISLYASRKRCVFKHDLKDVTEAQFFTEDGSLFHNAGPDFTNARSPIEAFIFGSTR